MGLVDIIHRKKTTTALRPATATVATVATLGGIPAGKTVTVARVATVAVAEEKTTDIIIMKNGGRDLPAYCATGNAWCSSKLGLTPCMKC